MSNCIAHGASGYKSKLQGNQSFGVSGYADYGPSSATGFYNG